MLARVVGDYWHALVRDVMEMGYRADDILTELNVCEIASIVLGAGPTTAVRYFLDQGWSREAHLLANLTESNAGMATLQQPYQRPGLDQRPQEYGEVTPGKAALKANVMTWDEMDKLEKDRAAAAASGQHRTVRAHAWAA
jgi:hypothetical protein